MANTDGNEPSESDTRPTGPSSSESDLTYPKEALDVAYQRGIDDARQGLREALDDAYRRGREHSALLAKTTEAPEDTAAEDTAAEDAVTQQRVERFC